ncbi:ABC transporter permease subunit [Bacillus sp. UMB0893]|uniref:ABC transporter permease subunit n=1 Tax=Bacillus sp. UMB0893 TaxID=2066053 RepID=UPI000C78C741|nr:ABC transporter permease [Bacillus sp. UMB0893]PLR67208.1 ABC transporter permease [Bacillus sp. UMB0893]
MNLAKEIGIHILLFLFIVTCLILVVLFPRDVEVTAEGTAQTVIYDYQFSWSAYEENVTSFFSSLYHDKNFGLTKFERPVEEEAALYFSRSIKIIVTALFLSLFFGILKGIYDAARPNRLGMIFGKGFTWVLQSIPDFFLFLCAQWVLIIYFRDFADIFGHDDWYSFLYPALLVSIYPALYISRITAAAFQEQEDKQYITVAHSKGLPQYVITFKHILKNSVVPILNHTGSMMIYILSNLLIVEYLLDYKGAAFRLFQAFDVTPVLSVGLHTAIETNVIIVFGTCFMLIVLVVQIMSNLIKKWVDPREGGV